MYNKFKQHILKYMDKIHPWLVVLSAASFLFLISILQNIFNSITPYLVEKFHFSGSEIGFLFGCYYYSNILFVMLAGILVDKFSVRKLLLVSFIVTNISVLVFALTKSLTVMALSRLALGIVGSFSGLSYFMLITRWFPAQKVALVTGIISAFMTSGGLVAQAPLVLAIEKLGWCNSLLLNFWVGMLLFLGAFVLLQDFPSGTKQQITYQKNMISKLTFKQLIKKIIINPQNWLIGMFCSLADLPVLFLGASWGNLYLQQTQNLTEIKSSYVTSMIFIGAIIGAPLIGWGSDKFRLRKMPLIIGTIFVLVTILPIMYITNLSFITLLILFFIMGVMTSSHVVCYPLVAESNPKEITGATTGFVASLSAISGVYLYIFSCLMDSAQNHKLDFVASHRLIILVLLGSIIISLFLALLIKETSCKASPPFAPKRCC